MSNQRRGGLGRGLGAIIPGGQLTASAPGVATLAVDLIEANPDQPRQVFGDVEMEGLVSSVREHGVLQPLVVTRHGTGYRLIAGERRLRAARAAGLTEVPVVLREEGDPQASLALSLIENIQRFDLNSLEEAEAYRRLLEEFGLSHEAVARQVGKSRTHVTNALRLLTLAPAVQGALLSGAITAGHARAIAGLDGELQEEALRRVLRGEMNVREAEALVQELAGQAAPRPRTRGRREQDPDTRELESKFRGALQSRVSLTRGRKGGKLVIQFASDEELDTLYRLVVLGERPG
ncbi:MAG: ParB family transcriptional regulator, chromosome partitioning protein [Chloroflexota bacterium]|jgi:ParB family chromosome partitioning protein|nr:ParB family transcriptional regulator, chromosome partitioning protein [Chloroflexota bacterium]